MARNRKIFEEAMRAGAGAAWDKNWDQAIAAYQRALAEFPNDVGALTSLGLAYFGAGRWESALEAYGRASQLDPDDPVLFERIGKTLERLGRMEHAAQAYLSAADRYLSQRQDANLALKRWLDAVRVQPNNPTAHVKLLQHYQQHGQIKEAVAECLALAHIYQSQGRKDYAVQICQHALKMAPHDPQVLATLDQLRYSEEKEAAPSAEEAPPPDESLLDFSVGPAAEDEERGSPVEIAKQEALSDLAESFFEEEKPSPTGAPRRLSKAEIDALLSRAIDYQTRGQIDEAIAAYEEVIDGGGEQPAVNFNLGLLYQEKLRFDEAIAQFQKTVSHDKYTLGSHFALGECYRAQGRIDEALEHFIEVLKIVDLATVQREQADDLIQLYESLANSYIAKGEREQALEFTNSLVKFLSEKGWEDKVAEARRRLDSLAREGPVLSLAEMLAVPGSDHILKSISLSQEYAKRKMFYTALEECYYALGFAPTYLPIHRQIAQIFLDMGKVDEAVAKFVVIADTYRIRGDIRAAVAMYQRALKLVPMDTSIRAKLIDMLISHGEIDAALEHYLIMADSYYHLAQMDRAREVYQEALRLAPRGDPAKNWEVRILHKIGDIDMQRVDWKRAIKVYRRIRKLAPDDERACLTLVDLHYRFNRPDLAIAELDSLLKIYRERGQTERIITILEDLVGEWPDDIPLRTRLAQVYLNAGNVEKALPHLDKLGDLQIEAGRLDDARRTIQIIIALNPPNVDEYRQLLSQL